MLCARGLGLTWKQAMLIPHSTKKRAPFSLICYSEGSVIIPWLLVASYVFSLLSLKKNWETEHSWQKKMVGGTLKIKSWVFFVSLGHAFPFKVTKNYSCTYWLLEFLFRPQTGVHLSLQT